MNGVRIALTLGGALLLLYEARARRLGRAVARAHAAPRGRGDDAARRSARTSISTIRTRATASTTTGTNSSTTTSAPSTRPSSATTASTSARLPPRSSSAGEAR